MGGSVSAGRNNDELIDNLVEGGLIKTQLIERVFRAVDRGIYYLPKFKESAYRDLAWREGLIHISAPCIYTRVMEALELKPNQYFLNIGSGTGYFSSMVGLIIGSNGVNHNLELHEELVNYSKQRVVEFMKTSVHFDDFDFCMPKFVQGNLLNLSVNDESVLYDRIYVGAGVTEDQENLIKSLLKINGIVVMPLNDCLVKIKRIDENNWDKNTLMSVSYASLVTDNVDTSVKISLPCLRPLSLQELCRFKIRQCIRNSIENEFENYFRISREKSTFNLNRQMKRSDLKSNDLSNHSDQSDYFNESEDEDEENGLDRVESNYSSFSRFERLFRIRDHNNHNNNNNNNHNEHSLNYEGHQFRLMIYNHLLDTRPVNSFAITLHPQSNNQTNHENDNNESEDESNEITAALVLMSPGSETNHSNDEAQETNSSSTSVENIENNPSQEEDDNHDDDDDASKENVKISKEIDIPNEQNHAINDNNDQDDEEVINKNLNKVNSNCDSGISEGSQPSSLSNQISMIKRKRSISINTSNDLDIDESSTSSSSSCSSSGLDKVDLRPNGNFNKQESILQTDQIKKSRNSDSISSNNCDTVKSIKEDKQDFIRTENLLRKRIMELPLSPNVKNFLLYNRDL